jgi:hypothetical protein
VVLQIMPIGSDFNDWYDHEKEKWLDAVEIQNVKGNLIVTLYGERVKAELEWAILQLYGGSVVLKQRADRWRLLALLASGIALIAGVWR